MGKNVGMDLCGKKCVKVDLYVIGPKHKIPIFRFVFLKFRLISVFRRHLFLKKSLLNTLRFPIAGIEQSPVNCSEGLEIDGGAGDTGGAYTESRREFAGHGKDSSTLSPSLSDNRPPSANRTSSAANRSRSRAISTANSRRRLML